jgi:hypothetical protein
VLLGLENKFKQEFGEKYISKSSCSEDKIGNKKII